MSVEIVELAGQKYVHYTNEGGKDRFTPVLICEQYTQRGLEIAQLLLPALNLHILELTGGIRLPAELIGSIKDCAACPGSDIDINISMPPRHNDNYRLASNAISVVCREIETSLGSHAYLGINHHPFYLDIQGV